MGILGNNKPERGSAIITIANNLNIVIQKLKKQNRNKPIKLLKKPGTHSSWCWGYSDVGRNWFCCTQSSPR